MEQLRLLPYEVLKDYLETRLNLLNEKIDLQLKVDADREIELDKRYEQRFASQQEALDLAFKAQQTAMIAALSSAEKAVTAAMAASDKAVLKAELASEKRFESVNEFRGTLADQQRTLMPREEVNVLINAISEKVEINRKQLDNITAERAGIKGGWGYAVGIIGFLLTLVTLAMLVIEKVAP